VASDGIYSILGLLPYGEHAKVKYKSNLCKECKTEEIKWFNEHKEAIDCKHPKKSRTEFPTYFAEELEENLKELMNLAIGENKCEPISWCGERRSGKS
jgi:hypothetical protein